MKRRLDPGPSKFDPFQCTFFLFLGGQERFGSSAGFRTGWGAVDMQNPSRYQPKNTGLGVWGRMGRGVGGSGGRGGYRGKA